MENFGFSETGEFQLDATFNEGVHEVLFSVDKEMSDKIMRNYYKARKKLFKVNGFRKGKVPKSMVEQRMGGKLAVYSATFSTYANAKLMELSPHKVVHTYDFDVIERDDKGWDVTFKVLLEAPATIKDEDLVMSFEIPKLETDDYVSYRLRAFARTNPILRNKESITGELLPAAEDDMLEVAVEAFLDDELFGDGSHDATNIRLVKGGVNPESLYEKLLGAVPGDEFSIMTTNPDEIPSSFKKDFAGKKQFLIKVKVNHVFVCEDPEIDDELAITAGYDNFEGWKNSLTDSAKRINKGREDQLKRTLVLNHIVETIEYPDLSEEWASSKANELAQKGYENTPVVRDELKKVAKQNTLLKFIGEHLGIEWEEDQQDKSVYERNEQGYAEKTLIHLIDEKVEWKHVNPRAEGDSTEDRSNKAEGPESEGSPPRDREALGTELQNEV
jgi:FKBP-type peptidyl-prolyl cis-trans isomerase (trigger factor)